MKIALLGTGKTGGRVVEMAGDHEVVEFNEANKPTVEKLKECDVAISFLPGPAMSEYIGMLIDAGIPVASGSTGMEWPDDINARLKGANLTWITASNFAIGMNLVTAMLKMLGNAPELFEQYKFKLHEIHHIHKKDHPSGTALSWQDWVGQDVEFTADRVGDTVGDHKITLETRFEDITVQHVAKDRKIFARGAIWTAERLEKGGLEPGLHNLSDVMAKELGL